MEKASSATQRERSTLRKSMVIGLAATALATCGAISQTSAEKDPSDQNLSDQSPVSATRMSYDHPRAETLVAAVTGLNERVVENHASHPDTLLPPRRDPSSLENLNGSQSYGVLMGSDTSVDEVGAGSAMSIGPLFDIGEIQGGLMGVLNDTLGQYNLDLGANLLPNTDTEIGVNLDVAPTETAPEVIHEPQATFTIATFNVLGNTHTARGGELEEWASGAHRFSRAMDILEQSDIDIIGLQEFQSEQRDVFAEHHSHKWGIAPAKDIKQHKYSENSIIWKKSMFKLVDSGKDKIEYFEGEEVYTPWIKLKHRETGKEFYVINTHDPVTTDMHGSNTSERIKNAFSHRKEATKRMKDAPVLLIGDFNSAFRVRDNDEDISRSKLTYCILTATGKLANSYDVADDYSNAEYADEPRESIPACPTKKGGEIDHVYVSRGVEVNDWERLAKMKKRKISDHDPTVANVTVN